MKKTENFNLNQWEATDPIRREDFNADNAIIDAALAACGDCSIVTGSFKGTGEAGRTLELGFTPKAVILISQYDVNNAAALAVATDSFSAYWIPNGVGMNSARCVEGGVYLGGSMNNHKTYLNHYIAFV